MNPKRIIGEATHTVTPWLDRALYVINRAAGSAITLPKATGSGFTYKFVVGTAVSSNSITIKCADSVDVMAGQALAPADTDSSMNGWETAASTDTVTLNGTTTGGKAGDFVELIDIGEGLWSVHAVVKQTGTEATPFSATV